MRKSLLLVLLVLVGFASKGQVLLSESFDGTTFPPTGWTVVNGSANANPIYTYIGWLRNTSAGTTGQQPTGVATHSGAGMAWFGAYWIYSPGWSELSTPAMSFTATGSKVVTFWTYRDPGTYYTDSLEVYVNTTASSSGGYLLAALLPTYGSTTGWTQYSYTIPAIFNGTTNYIIFRAVSAYGSYDMFLDDVDVTNLVPCTGTIAGGTASASPNPVCANVPITLTDVGYTVGGSMTYQWQSSPAGLNTWTNITGATTPIYTVAAGISAATDYRFQATCANNSSTGTSNTVAVTMSAPTSCYCAQAASSPVDDDIGQVVLGTFSNPTTAPSPLGSNSSSTGTYTNYTALGPIKVIAGNPTTFQVTQINSGSYYTCFLKAFIDLNANGSWSDPGEQLFAQNGPSSNTAPTFSGTITIPAATTPKITRMRVSLQESGSSTSVTPCNAYTWGETEDYTVQILSSTPPAPRVVNNSPLCPGGTLTFTATDTSLPAYPNPTFTITGPGIPGGSATNATGIFSFPNVTPTFNATYNVTLSSNGFTSNPTSSTATIYPTANLTVSGITSPSSCLVCDGSLTLNGLQPSTSYTLRLKKTGVAQPNQTITSTASGTYLLTGLCAAAYDSIQVTTNGSGNCNSNYVSAVVLAPNPPAQPVVTYQQPLCPGNTLQLTVTNPNGTAGATYSWSSTPSTLTNAPFASSGTTATRPNMTSAQNGSYCATVTVNGCVSAPGCVTVVVNAKDPMPIVTSPIQFCQFETVLPLNAQGVNLGWYGPYCPNPTSPNCIDSSKIYRTSITPRTDLPGNWVYGVTQQGTCLSDTAKIIVQVKPKPAKPNVNQGVVDYCQFSSASPLSASGTSIRWFATPTGGTGSATAPTPNTLVSGTYYYYVSQTVNGCESDRAVLAVNVKPKPAPPKVSSPLNLCQGDPVGPVTAIGQNLLWYTSPTGGVGVPVAPLPNTGYEDSFAYWVSQTVNGCESDRALISVYVNYKPNGVIVGSAQSICQDENDTFFYYGNARPDAQYVWFAPYPASSIVDGQGTQGPFIVHFDTAGTAVIRLQLNNKGCISTLIAAPITVRPLPKIDYSLKRDVCVDELVNIALTSIEPSITNYHFDFGSTDTTMVYSAPPGGPFGIRYHVQGDYVVAATATRGGCTSKPLKKNITVHDLPSAKISPIPSNRDLSDVCASDTLTLAVQASTDGGTYTWTPAAYFQSLQDSLNYIVRAVVSQSSQVKVTVKTAYGCESVDSVAVTTKPCCGVFFPNAFAPDGNVDKNKTFKPVTIGFHKVNVFRIVNRWGQTVYETKNERDGWNGTYNGVKQDMGVYYYYINYKCEGKDMEEHGEVTLLR